MKTEHDIKERLQMELETWFRKQCRDAYSDFYLYYLEQTKEHDSGILICQEQPPNREYKLASNEKINKGATVEQNFNKLYPQLRKLPVLTMPGRF